MEDPRRCPRCGRSNRCAQAGQDQPVSDCWCFHDRLPPGALDNLPADRDRRSCLCPACLQALTQAAKLD